MSKCIWVLNKKKTRFVPSCKAGARMSLLCATCSVCPICGKLIEIVEEK